jgi:alkanesulfonate monooxygenase SsuD/methylene tetrahydromethanopterin reductase-like flavin-dependent oxidoreductase (luciferase family)
MKLGIVMIPHPLANEPDASVPDASVPDASVIERVVRFGQLAEGLGFSGLWVPDSLGRGHPTTDPLLILATLCGVTRTIQLGTCVLQVPLRHPVELAHRAQSLHLLSGGRFQFGVGSGSTRADFEAVGADYDTRFKTLTASLDVMRRTWLGEAVIGPGLSLWPGTEGGPPLLLGAWRSARWIELAARVCQGWIASGIYSEWDDVATGVRMYRAAGGKRIVLANVFTDLRPEPVFADRADRVKISLICAPAQARDRLKRIEDLGLDEALLVCPFSDPEQLELIRGLMD